MGRGRGGGGGGGGGKGGGKAGGGGTPLQQLDRAFSQSKGASNNLVSLDEFRSKLGGTRASQDAAIREGRVARQYTLETHEGLLRPPTASQKAASIPGPQGERAFVYIVKR